MPASIQSIPAAADQEDFVSMGMNTALKNEADPGQRLRRAGDRVHGRGPGARLPYESWNNQSTHHFRWIAWIGTGLLFLSCAGIVLMLTKRRIGFYIFIAAALIILILDIIFFKFDWLRYVLHSGFIFLTGVVHYSRKCY
jgi:hypothetical protein